MTDKGGEGVETSAGSSPTRRHRLAERKGQSLVEFALVLPILLLIVVGILEFGLAFRTFQVVTNAAREGARTAVLRTTDAEVQAVVNRYLESGGLSAAVVDFDCQPQTGSAPNPDGGPPCTTGEIARVQVAHPISFAVLGALLNRVFDNPQVRSTSEMRTE